MIMGSCCKSIPKVLISDLFRAAEMLAIMVTVREQDRTSPLRKLLLLDVPRRGQLQAFLLECIYVRGCFVES